MTVSDKLRVSIKEASWIRKIFEEGKRRKEIYGADKVFDFSLGNPNLEPPTRFKEVLGELLEDATPGRHSYMLNAGLEEAREAVAKYLNTFNRPSFTAREIIMTVGAGGGLNIVFKTLLNPGEEVIIPKPYFVEYDNYLDNHQGKSKLVNTKSDFSLDLGAVSEAINGNTKAVMINSPNNPTGKVYPEKELEDLGTLLSDYSKKLGRPIFLISDEPYRKIVYDGVTVPSIFNLYNESFVVTSFSKDLSIPGERIGYVAVHPDISEKDLILTGLSLCNRTLGYTNAPALMQRAVAFLLEESIDISIYKRKRDTLCDALASYGYEFVKPQGAFYLFARTPIEDDLSFVAALQEENILVVPGSGFGGPGHIRIAYCVPDKTIEGALPGFERAIRKIKG